MNRRRLIAPSLVLATLAVMWVLLAREAPAPVPQLASSDVADVTSSNRTPVYAPSVAVTPGDLETPQASTASDALTRQRDRLHATAARLRARRDQALARTDAEPTVRTLDAHLARVQAQLARLTPPPG